MIGILIPSPGPRKPFARPAEPDPRKGEGDRVRVGGKILVWLRFLFQTEFFEVPFR